MAAVTIWGVRKDYGPLRILPDIDLDVADTEFITLVGLAAAVNRGCCG